MVLSDQFLQIATYLDSDKVYGLGEHERQHFPHDMNWDKWGMWTRDQAVEVLARDVAVQGLITNIYRIKFVMLQAKGNARLFGNS